MEKMANYFFKSLHAGMLIPQLKQQIIPMSFFCIQDYLNHVITSMEKKQLTQFQLQYRAKGQLISKANFPVLI